MSVLCWTGTTYEPVCSFVPHNCCLLGRGVQTLAQVSNSDTAALRRAGEAFRSLRAHKYPVGPRLDRHAAKEILAFILSATLILTPLHLTLCHSGILGSGYAGGGFPGMGGWLSVWGYSPTIIPLRCSELWCFASFYACTSVCVFVCLSIPQSVVTAYVSIIWISERADASLPAVVSFMHRLVCLPHCPHGVHLNVNFSLHSSTVWMVVGCILGYWVFVPTAFFSGLVAWPGSFNEYNSEGVRAFAVVFWDVQHPTVRNVPALTCPYRWFMHRVSTTRPKDTLTPQMMASISRG